MFDLNQILSDEELWEKEAHKAKERKAKLLSFGQHACGILVRTQLGMFAVDPEDGCVSKDLLEKGLYNGEELLRARSFTTAESEVLVVGAHLGTHVVGLAKTCRHVIAIEANDDIFPLLEANVHMNNCRNVDLHKIAAAEKEGKIEFLKHSANSGGSKRGPLKNPLAAYVYDEPVSVEIDAVPLDTLLGERSFDLILMDIEGSEYYALQGMTKILENAKVLCVEYLPHLLKNVTDITPQQFADVITPYFDWMYVPAHNHSISPKEAFANMLQGMYDANIGFENIYFIKNPLPARLVPR